MANKSTLKILVLGLTLISLAGCQILSNDPSVAQAAVESNQAAYNEQSPAIQDAIILEGYEYLQGLQDPIRLPDGSVTSGQQLAQFLLEQQIPVVWDSSEVCGGSSCSRQYCTMDGACSYEDGQPGIDPIYMNDAIRTQSSGVIKRLARELGHEAFHRMQPFGSGMITQIEEYTAFYLDTQLVKADWPQFDGIDPQDPGQLAGWFSSNGMRGYLRLSSYPGSQAQTMPAEQSAQSAESLAQE